MATLKFYTSKNGFIYFSTEDAPGEFFMELNEKGFYDFTGVDLPFGLYRKFILLYWSKEGFNYFFGRKEDKKDIASFIKEIFPNEKEEPSFFKYYNRFSWLDSSMASSLVSAIRRALKTSGCLDLVDAKSSTKKCECDMAVLMRRGCQCGGS